MNDLHWESVFTFSGLSFLHCKMSTTYFNSSCFTALFLPPATPLLHRGNKVFKSSLQILQKVEGGGG